MWVTADIETENDDNSNHGVTETVRIPHLRLLTPLQFQFCVEIYSNMLLCPYFEISSKFCVCFYSTVTIESTGALPPEVLFTEAVKILESKCERVISELSWCFVLGIINAEWGRKGTDGQVNYLCD